MNEVTDPFADQADFMRSCDQTVGELNHEQAAMYGNLIIEEHGEMLDAEFGSVDELDAVIDQIVVLIGYAHSMGWDIAGAWREVMRSNMAKVGADGKVTRRADGKILKPEGWTPPELAPFLGARS